MNSKFECDSQLGTIMRKRARTSNTLRYMGTKKKVSKLDLGFLYLELGGAMRFNWLLVSRNFRRLNNIL